MEKKSIKEIKEVLEAVELLGVAAMKVAADKKVAVDDLVHLVAIAKDSEKLVAAMEGLKEIDDEIKDLDQAEILELVAAVLAMVKKIKEAK
jgi:hypothetical protein